MLMEKALYESAIERAEAHARNEEKILNICRNHWVELKL